MEQRFVLVSKWKFFFEVRKYFLFFTSRTKEFELIGFSQFFFFFFYEVQEAKKIICKMTIRKLGKKFQLSTLRSKYSQI